MDQETKTSGAGHSPEREGSSFLKEAWGFIKVFVITAVIILLFVNIVAHPVTVVGDSMYPNLQDGEYGFTNLIGLRFSAPARGDVVVIDDNFGIRITEVLQKPDINVLTQG